MKPHQLVVATLAAALIPVGIAVAQPSLSHLQDIDIIALESTPIGIAVDPDGNGYVAGFSQRRVLKIENAFTMSPAASVLYRSSSADEPAGPITWGASLGLYTAEYRVVEGGDDQLMVAGPAGTGANDDGHVMIINPETGALVHQQVPNIGGSDGRNSAGAVFLTDGRVLTLYTQGNNYFQFNNALDNLSGSGFTGGPSNSVSGMRNRHITIAPNGDVYASANNRFAPDITTGTATIIRLINNGVEPQNAGAFAGEADWYTATIEATGGSAQGISITEIDGTEYAILSLRENAEIHFVETTDAGIQAGAPMIFTNDDLVAPASATVLEANGEQYLLVSQYGLDESDEPFARISVFGINGALLDEGSGDPTSAQHWNLY